MTKDSQPSNGSVIVLDCFGVTDRGLQRPVNQDQFLISDLRKSMQVEQTSVPRFQSNHVGDVLGKLLLVADGVGGSAAGEVASQLAIEKICQFLLNSMHWLLRTDHSMVTQFVDGLVKAVNVSHQEVRADASAHPNRYGMGTTISLAYVVWPMLYVVHVGDSRCYVNRGSQLIQLTHDQTVAQELVDRGVLTSDEAADSPLSRVLWSVIGGQERPTVMAYHYQLQLGDTVLVCSDGVNLHLDDDELHQLICSGQSSQQICHEIVSTVNQRGGRDNVTAVIARCLQLEDHHSTSR